MQNFCSHESSAGSSLVTTRKWFQVPGSKVFVQAAGLDLSLNLPNTKLDLGSMPKVSANLNLVDNDAYVAIFIPILLAGLAVPFVVMRAVMMELDCFVAHKKDVDPVTGNRYEGRTKQVLIRSWSSTLQPVARKSMLQPVKISRQGRFCYNLSFND